jgi:hypothetical protein
VPPPPLADQPADPDEEIHIHWAALPIELAVFATMAFAQYGIAMLSGSGPGRPAAVVAPLIFMVAGAYLADMFVPSQRLPVRWATGMGIGAFLSFGGVAALPAICCSRGGGTGWLPLVVVSGLLGIIGTLSGVLLGLAAQSDQARGLRLTFAPAVAVVPFIGFFPWFYASTTSGWLPLVQWLTTNYWEVVIGGIGGLVWAAALGGVMAVGVHLGEREARRRK